VKLTIFILIYDMYDPLQTLTHFCAHLTTVLFCRLL